MNRNIFSSLQTYRFQAGLSNQIAGQWSEEQAYDWFASQPLLTGCNFIPSNAANQFDMWQDQTFNQDTIDQELGFARSLGFNTMRVFLHNLAWQYDPEGLKNRIETYLALAASHEIKTVFVLLNDFTKSTGTRGVVQSPGQEEVGNLSSYSQLESYVVDILSHFANDERVLMWDLYNEPGNSALFNESVPLLKRAFEWAWSVRPSQPLTVGTWNYTEQFDLLNTMSLFYSDVVSFHHHENSPAIERVITKVNGYQRPVVCTEYTSEPTGANAAMTLAALRKNEIGAISDGQELTLLLEATVTEVALV